MFIGTCGNCQMSVVSANFSCKLALMMSETSCCRWCLCRYWHITVCFVRVISGTLLASQQSSSWLCLIMNVNKCLGPQQLISFLISWWIVYKMSKCLSQFPRGKWKVCDSEVLWLIKKKKEKRKHLNYRSSISFFQSFQPSHSPLLSIWPNAICQGWLGMQSVLQKKLLSRPWVKLKYPSSGKNFN